jgi:hypothetical protein
MKHSTHDAPKISRTKRVTVLLTPDELAHADQVAHERGVSRSDVLRSPLYAQQPVPGVVTRRRAERVRVERS